MKNRDSYRVYNILNKIFVIGNKGENGLVRPCPDLLLSAVSEVASPINFA
tara:strand:- start:503 stop:652 length:150 start_codon:yes stop_codon:yes gene_type:complete